MSDRDVLTKAINSSPNLSVAARRLDVSRRTLQNRMRSAGLPRGQAGRPRRELEYREGASSGIGGLIAAVAVIGAGVYAYKRYRQHTASDSATQVAGKFLKYSAGDGSDS